MNRKITITTAVTALTLAGLLSACGGDLEAQDPAPKAEQTKEAPAKEEPVAEETKAEEPAAEEGTRTNPFPKGTAVGNDELSVTIGEVTWDANAIVSAENQFNDPAPEGTQYVLVPLTVTNIADEEGIDPWIEVSVSFVADDGRSFDEASAVIPGEITDVATLYPGGVGTGNLLFALPADVIGGGAWAISQTWSDPVFVAAH